MLKWLKGEWIDLLRTTSVDDDLCDRLECGSFDALIGQILKTLDAGQYIDTLSVYWSIESIACVRGAYDWLVSHCTQVDAEGELYEPVIKGGSVNHILSYYDEVKERYGEIREDAFELEICFHNAQSLSGWPVIPRVEGGLTFHRWFFSVEKDFFRTSSLLPFLELILQLNQRVQGPVFCGPDRWPSEKMKAWQDIVHFYEELRGSNA